MIIFLYNLCIFIWIQDAYIANLIFVLDPSNSVIKRLCCIYIFPTVKIVKPNWRSTKSQLIRLRSYKMHKKFTQELEFMKHPEFRNVQIYSYFTRKYYNLGIYCIAK